MPPRHVAPTIDPDHLPLCKCGRGRLYRKKDKIRLNCAICDREVYWGWRYNHYNKEELSIIGKGDTSPIEERLLPRHTFIAIKLAQETAKPSPPTA